MLSIYQALAQLEASGEYGILCTIIGSQGSTPRHEGSKMLVYADGHILGTVGGGELENRVIKEALASFQDRKTKRLSYSMVDPQDGDPGVCGGSVEIYLEPIGGKPEVLVVGGGHVGKSVAHLAKWLGFHVIVSDDRAEFCTAESNPDADEYYPVAFRDLPSAKAITASTYVVITTRGSGVDVPGLPALLETNAGYIGIIGSKRRWLTTRGALTESGVSEEKIQRIKSPIGLELNAETPEEIAVSIMAEIIMLRNGGSGKSMAL
jgi:xanthine dehydrogenase accessory factor